MIAAALCLICLLLYVIKKVKDENYWKERGVPFHKPLPFFGNTLDCLLLRRSIGVVIKDLYFEHDESFFGIWVLNKPQLIVKCPDLIKQILVKDFNYFYDRDISVDEEVDDFSANITLFMKNPKWKNFRLKTKPMFSSSVLKNIYPQMQEIARSMISFINSSADKNLMDARIISTKYATQAIYSIALGIKLNNFQTECTPLVPFGMKLFTLTYLNSILFMLHYSKSRLLKVFKIKLFDASVVRLWTNFFLDAVENRKSVKSQSKDIVDCLIKLKEENNLRDNEIIAQVSQFLVAGHESTNATISLALYELALNKSIQQKLRDEVLANLDREGDISYDSLNAMGYLDKIIHETLRKYPVVPSIGRTCAENYKIPNSAVVIEKGVEVIISLSGLHHDPKYYPSPELFDPERFSIEASRKRPRYAYLPFGQGQRSCIGERLGLVLVKLGVAYIIKSFQIDICEQTNVPLNFDPKMFFLTVNGGIYIQFTRID